MADFTINENISETINELSVLILCLLSCIIPGPKTQIKIAACQRE